MVILKKLYLFIGSFVNFILPVPRGFGHIHAVERAWDTVLWDQARRDGAAFFHHREGPNGAGRPSLIYVVYLCFWKKRKWICSLLPKNFNPS